MKIIPVYNLLLLPNVTFYFKKEVYENTPNADIQQGDELLFLAMKEPGLKGEVSSADFYPVGMSAVIEKMDEEGNLQIHTGNRVTISHVELEDGQLQAEAVNRPEDDDLTEEEKKEIFERVREEYLRFVQHFSWGVLARGHIMNWKSMNELVCSSTGLASLSWEEKYAIMNEDSVRKRYALIEEKIHELTALAKINEEGQAEEEDTQEKRYREAALKKKIAHLQKELDDLHPETVSDIRRFEMAIAESGMNETARKEAEKILNRLKQEGPDSHEYGMLFDYLDFVTSLSWKKEPYRPIDLKKAEEILDEDHYGLKKVKERILQQLAVMALKEKQSGSILLFAGAPGTGKTSIGQSIAKALDRKYVRISLGGIRDEAEIRGHRRTYVGAMAGRIMEGIRRSGVSNPVVVLDEVDKLSRDHSGDPASALLEVLDPEQNNNFTDHYLNVPYDLSDVLFICTANDVHTIPEPLFNRMEMVWFPGYTAVEKFYIARKHLLPKARRDMNISEKCMKVSDKALRRIIADYTMEAGVRGLKKQVDTLCRAAAVKLVRDSRELSVSARNLPAYLGRQPVFHAKKLKEAQPGVVTGLAWTSAGGAILFIETKLVKGRGDIIITGMIGDVMKESVQVALTLVKGMYPKECGILKDTDLHVHIPDGAVPKDGPSAGITLVTALASLVTDRPVSTEYAMTGEVSLRGGVMAIGGLPEKLMAAQRAGITRVFIPSDNVPDLEEVAEEVKEKLEIIPVKKVTEVLKTLLFTP